MSFILSCNKMKSMRAGKVGIGTRAGLLESYSRTAEGNRWHESAAFS